MAYPPQPPQPPRPLPPGGYPPRPWYPEASQATLAFVLGILGILVVQVLAPFAWWIGNRERRAIAEGRRSPEGHGLATAGWVLGIVGTVLLGIGVLVFGLLLLFYVGFFALLFGVGVATDSDLVGLDDPEAGGSVVATDESRQEWLEAGPRLPENSSSGGVGDQDRCDLLDWFEVQFSEGMTTEEVRSAVGEPDRVADGAAAGEENWTWELGVCGFIDYDVYELGFVDGVLTEWRYVQG